MAIRMKRGKLAELDTSLVQSGELLVATDTDFVAYAKGQSDIVQLASKEDVVKASEGGTLVDVDGKRLIFSKYVPHLSLSYVKNYEVDTEYTFNTCDIVDVLKYVLDDFLHYNDGYYFNMHPDTIKHIKNDYNNIVDYVEENKGDYEVGFVSIAPNGSGGVGNTVDIIVALGDLSKTYTPTSKDYAEGKFVYRVPQTTTTFRIFQRYNSSGLSGRNAGASNLYFLNIGDGNGFNYTHFLSAVNLGIKINEVGQSKQENKYMFYWNFASQDPLDDKCRGIKTDPINGVITEDGISFTNGCLKIPNFSVFAGYFDIEIEAEFSDLVPSRNASTGDLITNQLFHMEAYTYFCLRSDGVWGFYNNRGQGWQPTAKTESYMPTDFHLKITYDGFWSSDEFGSAEFALESTPYQLMQVPPSGQGFYASFLGAYNGTTVGNCFASGVMKKLKIKWKPIDYTHVYFYGRFLFYKSPDGLNIQSNKVVSSNYDDFIEYFGTNKTFVRTGSGTISYPPFTELRNLNMLQRWHIRITNNANDFVELFIPINHETGVSGKKIEINAHCFSTGSADFEYGMACVDDDSLVIDSTQCVLSHTGIKKYFYTLINNTMDYIYFKIPTQSSQKTVLVSLVKIY